jgi:hypothetical protein
MLLVQVPVLLPLQTMYRHRCGSGALGQASGRLSAGVWTTLGHRMLSGQLKQTCEASLDHLRHGFCGAAGA